MLSIREASPEQYAPIGALTLAAYQADGFINAEHGYSMVLADAAARARAATMLVAMQGDDLVGAVTYCVPGSSYAEIARDTEAEFRMLAVAPALRGRRIGEALVRECLSRATREQRSALVLSVDRRNAAAARLYLRLGFCRDPERDWSPVPDVDLEAYRRDLDGHAG